MNAGNCLKKQQLCNILVPVAAVVVTGQHRILKPHLRTRGSGQNIQQPLHDDVVPHERQACVILHDRWYNPSVENVQESCAAAATVEKRQPHPAARTEDITSVWFSASTDGGMARYQHICMINDSSHLSSLPFVPS